MPRLDFRETLSRHNPLSLGAPPKHEGIDALFLTYGIGFVRGLLSLNAFVACWVLLSVQANVANFTQAW